MVLTRVLALRVRTVALALPHGSLFWLEPAQAIDLLVDEALVHSERIDEIVLIESEEAQRVMEPRIERARRRALADICRSRSRAKVPLAIRWRLQTLRSLPSGDSFPAQTPHVSGDRMNRQIGVQPDRALADRLDRSRDPCHWRFVGAFEF